MKLSKLNSKQLTKIAIVASIYIVLTMGLAPISYGAVQFRISEILNLIVFFNPIYGISLVLGCAVANLFSPMGIYDVIFGTFSTLLSVIFISKSKSLFVASLWPSLFIPLIVGLELYVLQELPLIATVPFILIGEFVVVTLIGYTLFKVIIRNEKFINILKN